jgi:trehalose 6-phosphate synthase
VAPLVDQLTLKWFVRDLDIRATLIANTVQEPLQEQLAAGKKAKIGAFFTRITQDERLYAVGYCASDQGAAGQPFPAG